MQCAHDRRLHGRRRKSAAKRPPTKAAENAVKTKKRIVLFAKHENIRLNKYWAGVFVTDEFYRSRRPWSGFRSLKMLTRPKTPS